MPRVRHIILLRHGQSTYNVQGRLNADPSVAVPLTAEGREQARRVRDALAETRIDLGIRTRFPRTEETLAIVLDGRDVPVRICPAFDDVKVGEFEGRPVGEYREWRRRHDLDDAPPGGESRLRALARYIDGFEQLATVGAGTVLAVLHDVPVRLLLNARGGDDPLDGPIRHVPNAAPTMLTSEEIDSALHVMRTRLEGAADRVSRGEGPR